MNVIYNLKTPLFLVTKDTKLQQRNFFYNVIS